MMTARNAECERKLESISEAKNRILFDLIGDRLGRQFDRVLVVGCGAGHEAISLSHRFGAEVVGIDTKADFIQQRPPRVRLELADARQMPFEDASFDLIYSFHALEHILPLRPALDEMRRVIRPAGAFCLGTPNKDRLIGYVGSATSLTNKIRWNAADWQMRLMGRWNNEAGAHAGFTAAELTALCRTTFGSGIDVSEEYYGALYSRKIRRIRFMKRFVYPAVYVIGRAFK